MMLLTNKELFHRFQNQKSRELWYAILLFGSMGAITWAIRGTSGWGGVDGTVVPGLTWGVLWYYLCWRRGIDARGIVFWLGMGLALGGELGYGQYTGWILGKFYVGDEIISISPFVGYWWFFLCGIGWAAAGGIILGWVLGERKSSAVWVFRSFWMVLLLAFLFAWPFVEWLAAQFVKCCPGLLFPNAHLGIYDGELGKHLSRTIYTNTQNFAVVVWWIGALVMAAIQKDKTTLFIGLVLGVGFGLGFMTSAAWCLGYGFAPKYIDWWKMWELGSGFNLGAVYAIIMYWATEKVRMTNFNVEILPKNKITRTLFLMLSGSVLIFSMSFEYFLYPGLFIAVFYVVSILFAHRTLSDDPLKLFKREKQVLLLFSFFILLFLLFHGGSDRAGVMMEIYPSDAVDQYAWPMGRILLFAPFLLVLVAVTTFKLWRIFNPNDEPAKPEKTTAGMIDLMMLVGFIGALSIWPSKIGVIYALYMIIAVYAFNRLEQLSTTGH